MDNIFEAGVVEINMPIRKNSPEIASLPATATVFVPGANSQSRFALFVRFGSLGEDASLFTGIFVRIRTFHSPWVALIRAIFL